MRKVIVSLVMVVSSTVLIAQSKPAYVMQSSSPQAMRVSGPMCQVMNFGAKGDGVTLDTAAIQEAIDKCSSQPGGGTVVLAGATKFLSGPLTLHSHMILAIPSGVTLQASSNHDDFPEAEVFKSHGRQSLLSAKDAEYITIFGGGTIDGNGASWWVNPRQPRPRLIVFDHCKHVLMEHITVQNSPMWQIVPYYSEDLTFRNMKVLAPEPEGHNTDGINPFSSKHILIDHVYIDTGDDNVAIKSGQPNSPGPDDPSVDITIRDCTFMKGHGLSVGSETAGGVQHLRVERVTFDGTTQGIRIKSGRDRGSDIGDFVYKDLTMKNVGTAIQITDYYFGGGSKEGAAGASMVPETRLTPHIHDITIENVEITGAKVAMDIEGLPESPIKNVTLKNVQIEAAKGAKIFYAEVNSQGLVVKPETGPPITTGTGASGELK